MTEREHDEQEPPRRPKPPAEPLLPETSKDDNDVGWGHEDYRGERGGEDSNDERLRRERPPHW
jgi:hypothetical protein